MQDDHGIPRLLAESESRSGSASRLVSGALVTEAYETARRAAVRKRITDPLERIKLTPQQMSSRLRKYESAALLGDAYAEYAQTRSLARR